MLISIILFLLLSLLTSIVICRDNRYCVNILFVGYLSTIFVILVALVALKSHLHEPVIALSDVQIADFEREFTVQELTEVQQDAIDAPRQTSI